MAAHDLSAGGDVLVRVSDLARDVLGRYDVHPESTVELINVSENATFCVSDPAGGRRILRVHRLGYHSAQAVSSELAWMDALRVDAGIRTPRVIEARDGSRVVQVGERGSSTPRCLVMFEFLPGAEPAKDDVATFERLGALSAAMHGHARRWSPPDGFTRFHWDYDGALGAEARWGRWQHGLGVGPAEAAVLGRLDRVLADRIRRYGTAPDRYGLVHADTRLANLLIDGDAVSVIDFDDCGFGWYLYDLATSVSFFEHEPQVPALIDSWLQGYRSVGAAPVDDNEIWTFVLFRRLLLLAWIGTHQGADIARQLGVGYTAGTCAMAETYLGRFG